MRGIWDIHSHILNGVDDGADTLEESLEILKMESSQGVEHVILTPHYRAGMFEPDMELINQKYCVLKNAVKETWERENRKKSMTLYLGCEFHADMNMTTILDAKKRPAMAGTQYVLVEFSRMESFLYIRERCFALMQRGYYPIIAHAERCLTLCQNDMEHLERLEADGCLIQLNAGSVLGEGGWTIKRWCHKAIRAGVVHFIASDTHDLKTRKPRMDECYRIRQKKHGISTAEGLLIYNAQELFMNGV